MATSVPKKVSVGESNSNTFGEQNSVASLSTVTVVSFTVPSGKTFFLNLVEFTGQNIATYEVLIDSAVEARKHTYFSGALAGDFFFNNLEVDALKVIELKVTNFRPEAADFAGRILGTEE